MPIKLPVCMAAYAWPSLVLTLSACSSEQLPVLPERAPASLAAEPVAPLQLAGGMAVKTLLDPLTGDLRDPQEVEWQARGSAPARRIHRPAAHDPEMRSRAPASLPEPVHDPICVRGHGHTAMAHAAAPPAGGNTELRRCAGSRRAADQNRS